MSTLNVNTNDLDIKIENNISDLCVYLLLGISYIRMYVHIPYLFYNDSYNIPRSPRVRKTTILNKVRMCLPYQSNRH